MKTRLLDLLWLVGVATWALVAWVAVSLFPAEPGPFHDRPFAKALLLGGVIGTSIMVTDLVRHSRRVWLWGLCAWGAAVCWAAASAAFGDDSDIDQILGWGVVLGGMIGVPLIIYSGVEWVWNRTGRAVRERPRRWHSHIKENSIEITRRKDPSG